MECRAERVRRLHHGQRRRHPRHTDLAESITGFPLARREMERYELKTKFGIKVFFSLNK